VKFSASLVFYFEALPPKSESAFIFSEITVSMEVQRISGIRYFRAHEAEVLHDTYHNYRPITIPKSTVAGSSLYVPLLYVSLNVNVVNTTSRTTLTHVFTNDSDRTIPEATYVFPLYDGATVVSFTCRVGPNTIRSSVETKTKAREEYQAAISRKDVALRLEEHTSEVFETSLGNIPPRTDVRIEITYIIELKPDISGEGLLVTIPASVAPRYSTPPEGYTKNGSSNLKAQKGMDIRIDVSAPVAIRGLDPRSAHVVRLDFGSAGQPVQTNKFGDVAAGLPAVSDHKRVRATLSHLTPVLDGDFILLIALQDPGFLKPRAVMEVCPRYPGTSAIRVSFRSLDLFTPQVFQLDLKDEIIFVVDRSGSMVPKISALKKSMDIFLRSILVLERCVNFNIVSFGTDCSLLWPESKSYNQTTLTEALKHLDTFEADMGGTEILWAIEKAVKSRNTDTDMRTEILILTDGEVWQEDQTIEFVRSTREKLADGIRFFALGVGDAVSHKLIEGIGRHGGGFADVLTVYSPGSWHTRLVRMLRGALSPSSWTCDVFPESENKVFPKRPPQERPYIKAPYKIPRLLDCTQTTCYILIENSDTKYDSVTIKGTSSGGKESTVDIPIERVEVSEPMILTLAVKAILSDMETGISQLHDVAKEKLKLNATAANTYVRRIAEQLGKQWSITSKWTSFVGVNRSSVEKYLTRIYRTNRTELAELTEPRGCYHLHNQHLTHGIDPEKDGDGSNEEKDDESSSSESSDGGDGGDGCDGNNWKTRKPKISYNGDGGGRGGNEHNGGSRDTTSRRNNPRGDDSGARGDRYGHTGGSGDGRGGRQGQEHENREGGGPRDVTGGRQGRENGSRDRGGFRRNERGNTDSNDQPNDHLIQNSGTNYGGGEIFGETPDFPFWSKWFPVGNDAARTTHESKNSILENMSASSQEKKTLFLNGSGIRKDVLMAEIEGVLGPDTTVRTGSNEGVGGYWITAEKSPGEELVHILKTQTEKWNEEIKESGNDREQSPRVL
jgi:hypothetical protein